MCLRAFQQLGYGLSFDLFYFILTKFILLLLKQHYKNLHCLILYTTLTLKTLIFFLF